MAIPFTIELTPQGASRLRALGVGVALELGVALRDAMENMLRPLASAFAPTPREEADLISTSVEGIGTAEPFMVGADRIRFMKAGGQQFLQQAIAEDPVDVSIESGEARTITATTGHVARLNQLVQFSWRRAKSIQERQGVFASRSAQQRRGQQLEGGVQSSDWRDLAVMWEEGGQPFQVRPRPPLKALLPEDPVPGGPPMFRTVLTKQIPAFQMYRKAWAKGEVPVKKRLQLAVFNAANEVGGGDWKVLLSGE